VGPASEDDRARLMFVSTLRQPIHNSFTGHGEVFARRKER
jgi:hypothetical protein